MNEIIELNSKGFWQDRKLPKASLEKCSDLFNKISGKTIVEIGTGIQGDKSGNSVLIWAEKTRAEKIYCLDLEQKHIDEVVEATKGFENVVPLKMNGFKFLKSIKNKIDLLYLDFWVEDKTGSVMGTARAENYLKAFKIAKKKMNSTSIILIDDTDHIDPWKQTLIVPEARKHGYQVMWCGRQTCLFRKG